MDKPKRYCRFNGCKNTNKTRGVHFYRFPKEEKRCKAWIKACKNEKLISVPVSDLYKNAYLCMDHFEDWCFMNITKKHRLVHNAVPCCSKSSLIEDPVSDEISSIAVDEVSSIAVSSNAIQTDSNSSILQQLLTSTIPPQASSENGQVWTPHQYSTVCSRHFTDDDFKTGLKKTLLQPYAVPSVFEDYPLYMQKLNQDRRKRRNRKIAPAIPAKNSNMVKNVLVPDTYSSSDINRLDTSKDVLTSKVKLKNTSSTSINKNNVTILKLQNVKTTEDQTMSSSLENISDVPAISSVTNFESENSNISVDVQSSSMASDSNINIENLNIPVDDQSSNVDSDSNTNGNNLNVYKDISVLEVNNKPMKSISVNTEVTIQQLNEQDNEIYTLREKLRLAKRALTICKDKIRELEKVNRKLIGMS